MKPVLDNSEVQEQVRGEHIYAHRAEGGSYLFRITEGAGETATDLLRFAYNNGLGDGADVQREADATLVEAEGCLYGEDCRVDLSPPGEREYRYRWASSPDEHAARCPIHLAAKIRGQA